MRIVQVADGGGGDALEYALIREEQVSGINGGDFTSGAWQTRKLNTKVCDTGNNVTLAGNQITLLAGTYRVKCCASAYRVDQHKIKLRNISDVVDLVIGRGSRSDSADATETDVTVKGRFTIASTKVIELQHRAQTSRITNGMGVASTFGVIEVYGVVELWKE